MGQLIFVFFFALALPVFATEPPDCELQVACEVGNRSYHARVPDGWDGKTPLPVLLHFHGWGRQGTLTVRHSRIAGATRKMGVLLLGPNGNGRSWDFWDASSGDIGFAEAVIEDAARRWPIDRSRIFVSGYSWGGSMAWRFACADGSSIAAVLAISGTLGDTDEKCANPVEFRHVHGTRDTVMDYPYGPDGALAGAVALWITRNGCGDKADSRSSWKPTEILPVTRHSWTKCSSGKSVTLDVHGRGHFIPRGWIAKQLEELL
ncbi:MAG: alpha/beta hydrolase family esterase [Rhizobiaceae bacterium]